MSMSDLFKKYDESNREWLEAKQMVEKKYNARSQVIKEIFETNESNKKIKRKTSDGNFQTLTICKRGDSYFFRGENDNEVPVVE